MKALLLARVLRGLYKIKDTRRITLLYFINHWTDNFFGVVKIGKRNNRSMRSYKLSLEIHKCLICEYLVFSTICRSCISLFRISCYPHQLSNICNFFLIWKLLLNQSNYTWNSFFSLKAKSSIRSTIISVSSSKKEHLR